MDDAATPHKDGYGILKVRAGCSRTDIEQSVLFPVVGGGWITLRKKDPYTRPVGEHWFTRAQGNRGS